MKKRVIGAVCAAVMCVMLLAGCGKEASPQETGKNDPKHLVAPAMVLTSATVKAGDEVTLDLSITESSMLWGFSWEINYDIDVMKPVAVVVSEAYSKNFEMTINKDTDPMILQGAGREIQNYTVVGDVAKLTFRVEADAAPGEYHVNVGCKEGNNIDVDANDVPFVPVSATVTIE